MELYVQVRRACMVDGRGTREAALVFGLHRDTERKMLKYSGRPRYRRRSPPRQPKLESWSSRSDPGRGPRPPRKQRHSVKRIFERLRGEHGFGGKYTIVEV